MLFGHGPARAEKAFVTRRPYVDLEVVVGAPPDPVVVGQIDAVPPRHRRVHRERKGVPHPFVERTHHRVESQRLGRRPTTATHVGHRRGVHRQQHCQDTHGRDERSASHPLEQTGETDGEDERAVGETTSAESGAAPPDLHRAVDVQCRSRNLPNRWRARNWSFFAASRARTKSRSVSCAASGTPTGDPPKRHRTPVLTCRRSWGRRHTMVIRRSISVSPGESRHAL